MGPSAKKIVSLFIQNLGEREEVTYISIRPVPLDIEHDAPNPINGDPITRCDKLQQLPLLDTIEALNNAPKVADSLMLRPIAVVVSRCLLELFDIDLLVALDQTL